MIQLKSENLLHNKIERESIINILGGKIYLEKIIKLDNFIETEIDGYEAINFTYSNSLKSNEVEIILLSNNNYALTFYLNSAELSNYRQKVIKRRKRMITYHNIPSDKLVLIFFSEYGKSVCNS